MVYSPTTIRSLGLCLLFRNPANDLRPDGFGPLEMGVHVLDIEVDPPGWRTLHHEGYRASIRRPFLSQGEKSRAEGELRMGNCAARCGDDELLLKAKG